jgi:hypothetical protein
MTKKEGGGGKGGDRRSGNDLAKDSSKGIADSQTVSFDKPIPPEKPKKEE